MGSGRSGVEKNAISQAIHHASVSAGYPDDDMFQRFLCLEPDDLKIDPYYPGLAKSRTGKMLMVEVLLSSATVADRRRRLLASLVEELDRAGVDPNDIMVFFTEFDRENSSFGGGTFARSVDFA
jgi:hypothetical protein